MRSGHRAVALAVIVAFYLTLVGPRASLLVRSDEAFGRVVGVAVLLLPLAGVWFVWREGRFGRAVEELGAELAEQEVTTPEPLEAYHGTLVESERSDLVFAARRLAVESAPQDWAAWYRLGLAYDAVGDRSSGRAAMRHAVALRARARTR